MSLLFITTLLTRRGAHARYAAADILPTPAAAAAIALLLLPCHAIMPLRCLHYDASIARRFSLSCRYAFAVDTTIYFSPLRTTIITFFHAIIVMIRFSFSDAAIFHTFSPLRCFTPGELYFTLTLIRRYASLEAARLPPCRYATPLLATPAAPAADCHYCLPPFIVDGLIRHYI